MKAKRPGAQLLLFLCIFGISKFTDLITGLWFLVEIQEQFQCSNAALMDEKRISMTGNETLLNN